MGSPPTAFFHQGWRDVSDPGELDNAFKVQWEMFLRHVGAGEPFSHDFLEGAKGVQLAELGLRSWAERRWVEVPPLNGQDGQDGQSGQGEQGQGRSDAAHRAAPAR